RPQNGGAVIQTLTAISSSEGQSQILATTQGVPPLERLVHHLREPRDTPPVRQGSEERRVGRERRSRTRSSQYRLEASKLARPVAAGDRGDRLIGEGHRSV